MKSRNLVKTILAVSLVLCLGLTAVADTIRLRDGTVIRGEIVSFKDQQFVVLIGAGCQSMSLSGKRPLVESLDDWFPSSSEDS